MVTLMQMLARKRAPHQSLSKRRSIGSAKVDVGGWAPQGPLEESKFQIDWGIRLVRCGERGQQRSKTVILSHSDGGHPKERLHQLQLDDGHREANALQDLCSPSRHHRRSVPAPPAAHHQDGVVEGRLDHLGDRFDEAGLRCDRVDRVHGFPRLICRIMRHIVPGHIAPNIRPRANHESPHCYVEGHKNIF